jgi:uncharacterized damage-inducible protein DinB
LFCNTIHLYFKLTHSLATECVEVNFVGPELSLSTCCTVLSDGRLDWMQKSELSEPWLRGTLTEVPAVQRAVMHALELAREDLERWCDGLSDEELHARPGGIASVAFHLRHIARSIDRLLSYAEGKQLSTEQISAMKAEMDPRGSRNELMAELVVAIAKSGKRIRAFSEQQMQEERHVGKKQLPTSVGGLLVHVADHTQRHVGQAITTAKIVVAQR